MIIHILPIDDIKEHGFEFCECQPTVEMLERGSVMYVHHSYDWREHAEEEIGVALKPWLTWVTAK